MNSPFCGETPDLFLAYIGDIKVSQPGAGYPCAYSRNSQPWVRVDLAPKELFVLWRILLAQFKYSRVWQQRHTVPSTLRICTESFRVKKCLANKRLWNLNKQAGQAHHRVPARYKPISLRATFGEAISVNHPSLLIHVEEASYWYRPTGQRGWPYWAAAVERRRASPPRGVSGAHSLFKQVCSMSQQCVVFFFPLR
jgi:hypothetical protein